MGLTDLARALSGVYFVAFVIGLSLAAVFTLARWARYRRAGEVPPVLLGRDVFARVSLSLPLLGILLIRMLGIDPFETRWGPWWLIGSGALAVIGVWVYVYYEIFVIER